MALIEQSPRALEWLEHLKKALIKTFQMNENGLVESYLPQVGQSHQNHHCGDRGQHACAHVRENATLKYGL